MSRLSHYLASIVIVVVLVEEKSVILALAVRNRSYTDKDGVKRYVTEILANEVLMVGGKQ